MTSNLFKEVELSADDVKEIVLNHLGAKDAKLNWHVENQYDPHDVFSRNPPMPAFCGCRVTQDVSAAMAKEREMKAGAK